MEDRLEAELAPSDPALCWDEEPSGHTEWIHHCWGVKD